MGDSLSIAGGGLSGSDVEAAVELQRIAIDDFSPKNRSDPQGKRGLTRACWTGNHDQGQQAVMIRQERIAFQGIRAKRCVARNGSYYVLWCAPHPFRSIVAHGGGSRYTNNEKSVVRFQSVKGGGEARYGNANAVMDN